MFIIRKIVKIIFFFSLLLLFIPVFKEKRLEEKIDNMLNDKKVKSIYEGYLFIPKFNYKNLIKRDESALDENMIEMLNFSDNIGGNNIVLAGHNNRYVFNKLYSLDIGDEIVLSDFGTDYKYKVSELKYIKVDDFKELEKDNSLVLITCTYDNQKRFIVILDKE
ncbi:MAG: sortase [Bacilli bacterium]|nr:sortase [Bacilli bacterium]